MRWPGRTPQRRFFGGGEVWIEHLKLEDVQSGGFVEIAGENAATYTVNRNDQKKRIQVAISE